MGNQSCTCILGNHKDINTFKLEHDIYINSQHHIQVETNLHAEQDGCDEMKKTKSAIDYELSYENCPGVLLKSDTLMGRVNEKVLKREKELPPFEYDEIFRDNTLEKPKLKKIVSILYPDNSIYQGFFEPLWIKNGFGTLLFNDGSKYVGTFAEDKIKGKGRLIYNDGDYYQGEFDDNKPNGKGVLVRTTEFIVTYKGDFRDGLKDGFGEERISDGSYYEGQFIKDYKSGIGKFTWPDETVYQGHFNKNEIDGFGRMIYPENKIYIGNWKNNKIEGKGIFLWPDGKFYLGNYHSEKKNGFGIFLFTNGKRYEGYWLQGKQHGLGVCFLKNVGRLGEWRFGKKIRWLSTDISNSEDPAVKANVAEIKKKTDDLLGYIKSLGLPHYDDDNIKEKLVSFPIN